MTWRGEGAFELGAVHATARYLNHPGIALGYRLEADGAAFVYATDHEPHSPYPRLGDSIDDEVHHEDRRHIEFLAGAQLVIHDAQYTLEEYRQRMTWGHSPVERVVDFAVAARASGWRCSTTIRCAPTTRWIVSSICPARGWPTPEARSTCSPPSRAR